MTKPVTMGASMICTQGLAPSSLGVMPINRVMVDGKPVATVKDHIPMVNIPSFGMCRSIDNPQVKAATAAAMGALTPMQCMPIILAPWKPGAKKTRVAKKPCLTQNSKCNCLWGGSISIIKPGSKTVSL